MPKISLVVCLYKERDLLERLLQHAEGCYDDLVVVHDGPEEAVSSGERRSEVGDQRSETVQEPTDYPGSRSASIPIIRHQSSISNQQFPAANHQSAISNKQFPTANQQSSISNQEFPRYEEGWKSPEELSLEEPDAPPIEIARDYAELPKDAPIPTGYRLKAGFPQPGSIHELVARYGGRFYEGPRCFQQEPHWPFAWWAAKHDWILRLDADEFPSRELREWIKIFRSQSNGASGPSGYTFIWPHWNGNSSLGNKWPDGRVCLFDRKQVRFLGLAEITPIPQIPYANLPLVVWHQPKRKSFGIRNILFRRQCYSWRWIIARTIFEKAPGLLPRWKYDCPSWPVPFSVILQAPGTHLYRSLFINWRSGLKAIIKNRLWSVLYCFYAAGWNHALICINILILKWKSQKQQQPL